MSKMKLVLFMYSQMQIDQDKEINQKIGRDFQCGEVSLGASNQKFSKMIPESDLAIYQTAYPDAKIIASGDKNKMIYKKPSTPFIGSGEE